MGLARDEIIAAAKGEGCLGKSAPDETVFILCARDPIAAWLVRGWAIAAFVLGVRRPKVYEAWRAAGAMRRWKWRAKPN